MVFIDFQITERKGGGTTKAKVVAKEEDMLDVLVKKAVAKFVEKNNPGSEDKGIIDALRRIKSIECNNSELLDFMGDSDATIGELNSPDTPIFASRGKFNSLPLKIMLPPPESEMPAASKKKPKKALVDVLMGRVALNMKHLQYITDTDKRQEINEQILEKVYLFYEEIGLGYCDGKQKDALTKNATHIASTLCFVEKHWKVLFRADRPHIPDGDDSFSSSILLSCLSETTRYKNVTKGNIDRADIVTHVNTINTLDWNHFAVDAFNTAMTSLKDDLKIVVALLDRRHVTLTNDSRSKVAAQLDPDSGFVSAFKNILSTVPIAIDEFHTEIDSAFKPKKRGGSKSVGRFGVFVKAAVLAIIGDLRGIEDYTPIFITDERMGIDAFSETIGEDFLSSIARAKYRDKFRKELAHGVERMKVHVFGKLNSGSNTDCIFVWKVPVFHGDQHSGKVAMAINQCKEMAPREMGREAVKHFNRIVGSMTAVPSGVRVALRNYLFHGDPNPNKTIADEYVQFVMDLAAGQPINETLLSDGRVNNSRGGKGINTTQYEEFWKACREVLLPNSATEERRHSDTVYASGAHSIPNLVKQATDILQKKVVDGVFDKIPPIPSTEWVRLQFVPNRADTVQSAKFTGRLMAKFAVQTRSLRKEHVDQHWVNAMTRYYLEWIVELKKKYDGVVFCGQDDKAKVPVGDKVPVSTGVRANNRGIISVGDDDRMSAMDHDFHYANITPSVTLLCNIPDDISGSFYMGDEDGGTGQIFVTLRDSIFDPSEVFDHCAQLIDVLRQKGQNPTILVLQTDGGPDHSLKRVAVKLALVSTFRELDLDHIVVLRGAPNGSARNKIERAMSPINLALAHVALQRATMAEWAEVAAKNCSSMKTVREVAKVSEDRRSTALKDIPKLEIQWNNALILECIATAVHQRLLESGLDVTDQLTSQSTTVIIQNFLGIDSTSGSSNVSRAVVTRSGVSIVRDSSLQTSVLSSKLEKAKQESSRAFRQEYHKSMSVPIGIIARRISLVKAGNHYITVRPRVPTHHVDKLHDQLKKIDPAYSTTVCKKEHLKDVPVLVAFMESHSIVNPYSFDIKKCNNVDCCGVIRIPMDVRELAMQRQPTPRRDPQRKGNFLRRNEALKQCSFDDLALVDLSDLPSNVGDRKKEETKLKCKRDLELAKSLKLKSWDSKKVRSFVACYHCGKRRCIYTPYDDECAAAEVVFQQKLESVSERFSCGDLLFSDNHPLSKVIVQKLNLTCESPMEKAYFDNRDRTLKVVPACYHCGEMGASSFVLGLDELRERGLTDGYTCFPICVDCLKIGKKVAKGKVKDTMQARKESAAKSNKGKGK